MKNLLTRFGYEDDGQDLIEYALLAGLIALICVAAITTTGSAVNSIFTAVSGQATTAAS